MSISEVKIVEIGQENFSSATLRLPVSRGTAVIVKSADEIPFALRQSVFQSQAKDFRYYEVIEKTLRTQFEYRFLVMQDADSGQWAIQPLFFVNQDLLAGSPEHGSDPFGRKLRRSNLPNSSPISQQAPAF
jgi:hypothetical protein